VTLNQLKTVTYNARRSSVHCKFLKITVMIKDAKLSDMKTLASCINKLVLDGYTEDFKVGEKGLCSLHQQKDYRPEEIHIRDFFRFEGASDPADNSILYAIETSDGTKGTLTDAYGPYSDPQVTKFMAQVEDINKKNAGNDRSTS
jgi:hypothetical protein